MAKQAIGFLLFIPLLAAVLVLTNAQMAAKTLITLLSGFI